MILTQFFFLNHIFRNLDVDEGKAGVILVFILTQCYVQTRYLTVVHAPNKLHYSCFNESWENCLVLETFFRALHSVIYKVMEIVNTKPYVLGISTKFPRRFFFNMLIFLSCSFLAQSKEPWLFCNSARMSYMMWYFFYFCYQNTFSNWCCLTIGT